MHLKRTKSLVDTKKIEVREGWLIHVQNTKEMENPMPNNFELWEGIGHSLCTSNQT
jgi:hypothetical protein